MDPFGCFKGLEIAKGCKDWGRVDFLKGDFYEQTDWRLDKFTHTSTSRYYSHDVSSSAW
jgi:hypothetical protein